MQVAETISAMWGITANIELDRGALTNVPIVSVKAGEISHTELVAE